MNGTQQWLIEVTPKEKEVLTRVLNEMRRLAAFSPTSDDNSKYPNFLPTFEQRKIYNMYVCMYYNNYIAGREIKHKLLMLHWAAIYYVIAKRLNIALNNGTPVFYGPEYDRFLTEFCGIVYNKSKDRKGRYRQVGDVYKKFSVISDSFGLSENDATMYNHFTDFCKNFRICTGRGERRVSYELSSVPGGF